VGDSQEGKLSQAKATRTAQLVNELEELAQRCGIEVRHEKLLREVGYRARSGSCKVKEKNLVILDRTLEPAEQVEILAEALRGQDLENLYLSPAARRLLQEDRG
jgi:broad specificity phosphatase PhoE